MNVCILLTKFLKNLDINLHLQLTFSLFYIFVVILRDLKKLLQTEYEIKFQKSTKIDHKSLKASTLSIIEITCTKTTPSLNNIQFGFT